eukprot:164240-Pelagomonas_calceolata.AAC.4
MGGVWLWFFKPCDDEGCLCMPARGGGSIPIHQHQLETRCFPPCMQPVTIGRIPGTLQQDERFSHLCFSFACMGRVRRTRKMCLLAVERGGVGAGAGHWRRSAAQRHRFKALMHHHRGYFAYVCSQEKLRWRCLEAGLVVTAKSTTRACLQWEEWRWHRALIQCLACHSSRRQWEEVALALGTGRSAAQCLREWLRATHPQGMKHKNTKWSLEDSKKLEALVAKMGRNWQVSGCAGHSLAAERWSINQSV